MQQLALDGCDHGPTPLCAIAPGGRGFGADCARGDRRNPGQSRHGLGDLPPDQQAGQEPALLDSLDGPLRPLGLGGTGAAAGQDRLRVPGQGAEGDARLGAEVGVPGDVLLDDPRPALSSRSGSRTSAAGNFRADHGLGKVYPIPDMDDPIVLERHLDFIKRLGERYDGHPDIDHVDLGSIGWWGEWHLSGSKNCKLPTLENRKKVVDAYLAAFKKTPLLMLIGGEECLKYATQHGTGWRADCLGDMGFLRSWCHMRQGYPLWIREAGVQDTWKTAPVAWETCWDMRKWVAEGWSLRYIFNYALALHGSYINNKSAPLPTGENVRPEIERFLRRLGYRLVLKELKHPAQVAAGRETGTWR